MDKKKMAELLNDEKEAMTNIVNKAEAEGRALTEEEITQFNEHEAEAKRVQATVDAMDRVGNVSPIQIVTPAPQMTQEEKDIKAFAGMVRDAVTLGEIKQTDITKGANGAIVPSTIANKIIDYVKNISPIFARATKYNVKGTLHIPKITDANDNIAMAYADEFTDLTASEATFTSVDLTGFLAGVLCKVSNSLINNSDFNVTNEVVKLMARAVATFYEKETLIGTSGKSTGISGATQIKTAASATAVTADELIEVQDMLNSAYQQNACWIMKPATLTAIRKLKYSGTGEYLLTPDFRAENGYMLLGKPVFTSDQCPAMATTNKAIVYADIEQALAVKLVENFEVQVLREKYAIQHATGLVGWTEFDSDVQNDQAIAIIQMA